jgi:hypothetical protein
MRLLTTTNNYFFLQPRKHNLPPGVELVDPASLGFDASQIDLSSLLGGGAVAGLGGALGSNPGNLKLTPVLGLVGHTYLNNTYW